MSSALASVDARLDSTEQALMMRAKLGSTVFIRSAFILLVSAVVGVDYAFHVYRAAWWVMALPGSVVFAYNAAVILALRQRRFAPWMIHVVLTADILALCTFAGLCGPTGVAMIAGIVLVVGGQALGTPEIARRQFTIAVPAFAIARWLGLRVYGYDVDPSHLAIEVCCLAVIGGLAMRGPAALTRRVRRARSALAALERGEFTIRLPTRAQDDFGFLAASFNSTAEALGRAVDGLQAEIAERERTQLALRESEARLVAAREDAQAIARRMTIVAEVAGRVIGADSLAALYDVLRAACAQVLDFEAVGIAVFGSAESAEGDAPGGIPMTHVTGTFRVTGTFQVIPPVQPLGASDPALAGDTPEARSLAARVLAARASIVDGDPDNPLATSVLASPVVSGDLVLGYLALRAGRDGAFRGSDVQVLEALAALAATAIRNVTMVDALRDSREAFAHQARHDPLTGLGNRAHLHEWLVEVLGGRAPERVSVLVLDLDGFKRINDSLGHAAGDALLVQVAERLRGATRGSDTVARLGGDEFAILLENTRTPADAALVARRVLHALRAPFVLEGAEAIVGTSIGIARAASDGIAAPGTANETEDDDTGDVDMTRVDVLLRDADLAMYRAKAAGKGRYVFFDPTMQAPTMQAATARRVEPDAPAEAFLLAGAFTADGFGDGGVPARSYCPLDDAEDDFVSTTNVASSFATARIQLASVGRAVGG